MRRSQAFPSKYIGKDDVKNGVTTKIKDVDTAMVKGDGGDECKTIMFFSDPAIKPLILNTINWMTLEDAYGEESDDWRGRPVELYVDPNVMFAGKRVGGVRVRIPNGSVTESFGDPDKPVMTFSQAIEACEAVGISKNELVLSLKGKGCEGYNGERDTPHVLQIIENVKNRSASPVEQGATVPPEKEDDIPF